MSLTVAHLTSAHPRFDHRIFSKECLSLLRFGYRVKLIVADGLGNESRQGIEIFDVGVSSGRLSRILMATRRIFFKAQQLDCDLYHIHDPELIPVGFRLLRLGKKVIFDSHEDVPTQLRQKVYLNKTFMRGVSFLYSIFQKIVLRKFSFLIAATPRIKEKLAKISSKVEDVCNFPLKDELTPCSFRNERQKSACYVGGMCEIRGLKEMIESGNFLLPGVKIRFAGKFFDSNLEEEFLKNCSEKFEFLGFLDRDGVKDLFENSSAGLVVLHPVENYIEALPVKLFEYMAAGLPVIASDFPIWKDIVEGNQCGLCVDPLNPKEIAVAINTLMESPEMAREMGDNGRTAIEMRYNWQNEEEKLLSIYKNVLNGF
ncbi:MAG: glycosyltransferase family 4 protein [Candidatus Rifleibacteriota bacterium]